MTTFLTFILFFLSFLVEVSMDNNVVLPADPYQHQTLERNVLR
jgi:hypothetical protein